MKTIATCCLAILASAAAPAAAWAQSEPLDITQNYSGTSTVPVFDIATYNSYANGSGITNSFSIDAGAFSFDDPFLKSSANPPLLTYFLGVASYSGVVTSSALSSVADAVSPNTVALPQHLVLAVSSAYAAGLISGGQDFSTIFPTYDENSLITDLHTIGSNSGNSTDDARNAAIGELFNFDATVQSRDGLTSALGGPLSLLSFSNATLVGQGVASLVPLGGMTPAVPEPASWVMMIVGLGIVGYAMRRRRQNVTTRVQFA